MDTYAGGAAVLFIAICEIVGLMWFYGVNRFCADLKLMLGHDIGWYWKASWLVFSPCILGFLFIYGLVKHTPIMYDDIVSYPTWADGIGWLLAMLSMAMIPIWGTIMLLKNWKNSRKAFEPERKRAPEMASRNSSTTPITVVLRTSASMAATPTATEEPKTSFVCHWHAPTNAALAATITIQAQTRDAHS
ncbi:hypothetical protein MRX96_048481 [Rhipicephalus microplus]